MSGADLATQAGRESAFQFRMAANDPGGALTIARMLPVPLDANSRERIAWGRRRRDLKSEAMAQGWRPSK